MTVPLGFVYFISIFFYIIYFYCFIFVFYFLTIIISLSFHVQNLEKRHPSVPSADILMTRVKLYHTPPPPPPTIKFHHAEVAW